MGQDDGSTYHNWLMSNWHAEWERARRNADLYALVDFEPAQLEQIRGMVGWMDRATYETKPDDFGYEGKHRK